MKSAAILSALIVAIGAFAFYVYLNPKSEEPQQALAPISLASKVVPPPPGQLLYRTRILHFQIAYPEDLVKRIFSKGNTTTVTFEDDKGTHGFQVFVVPFKEETVSAERLKYDIPSGVVEDPLSLSIDGANATAFYSKDSLLGETREIWFAHGGLLYEITARKDLDTWLAEIMRSWKFI